MDADKKQPDSGAAGGQTPPAGTESNPPSSDALGRPNDDAQQTGSMSLGDGSAGGEGKPLRKLSPIKKILKRVNVYLILFAVTIIIGLGIVGYSYITGSKKTPSPTTSDENLTQSQLKQLANSNATVGGSGETLTVQGNAVFSGNVLVRSNLQVAGTIQMGGPLTLPELNVTSSANLAGTQINNLQVAGASTFQSLVTLQNGLTAGGNSSFTGTLTVGTITASKITMSNNALLTVPNHVSFTGSSPRISSGNASVSGSDTSGTVTINSGAGAGSCMATVTFSAPFSSTPHVLISPVNAAAGGIGFYVNRTTTNFQICTAAGAPSGQQFGFSYFITD